MKGAVNWARQQVPDADSGMMGSLQVTDNGNVYLAGQDNGEAVYWLDGTEEIIGTVGSQAGTLDVIGTEVYIAGNLKDVITTKSAAGY